jgi:DNA-binding transcriptional ArsR family regulator
MAKTRTRGKQQARRVAIVDESEALVALSHPTRVALLDLLREPMSAAGAARALHQPRQRVNHHLKALEDAGLVVAVETRQQRGFVETLYRAVAGTFLVSQRVAWGGDKRRIKALRSQHALETLVLTGERLQRDAAALLDRAAFDGDEIASAAVTSEVRFATDTDRAAFIREHLAHLKSLMDRYASRTGDQYRVVLAVHPDPDQEEQR